MMVASTRMIAVEMAGRARIRMHFAGELELADKLDVGVKERKESRLTLRFLASAIG